MLKNKDILITSPQTWYSGFVSKHYVASQLARENKVYFVNPPRRIASLVKNLFGAPLPRFQDAVPDNIQLVDYYILPKYEKSSAMAKLTDCLAGRMLRRACPEPDLILSFTAWPLTPKKVFPRTPFVYYNVDLQNDNSAEKHMISCADVVIASSESNYERLKAIHKKVFYLPHGVDIDILRSAPTPEPEELSRMQRPILGFIGNVSEIRLDIELLVRICEACPQSSVVLVGPYKESLLGSGLSPQTLQRLEGISNLHLLGQKSPQVIGQFIRHFDVCIVPYDITQPRIQYSSPIKLLQFFALGKPVVTTGFTEAFRLTEFCYVAKDRQDFLRLVRLALEEEEDDILRKRRQEYAESNTWELRCSQLEEIVESSFDMAGT